MRDAEKVFCAVNCTEDSVDRELVQTEYEYEYGGCTPYGVLRTM